MAKRRRNIGRVKRYRHNFYKSGRSYWAKRILMLLAVAALVFVLGFVVAPAVLDWGSSFWYTTVKHQPEADPAATAVPEGQTPEAQPTPSPVPTATPVPDPVGQPGSLKLLRLSALQTPEAMEKTAQELRAAGAMYGIVPLKDESGYVYYPSQVPQAAASVAAVTIDPAAVAAALKAQNIRPVAYISAFRDPMVSRSMGIRYQGSDEYMWLDNKAEAGGKRWMNPYSPEAVQYIGDLIQEAVDMGFEAVVLTGVQFPRQENGKQNFGDTYGRDRAAQLAADVAAWEQRFADTCRLVYEIPYENCVVPSSTLGGVMPGALGMRHVMLRMPDLPAEGDPEASAAPTTLNDVLNALYAGGVEQVTTRTGIDGEVLAKP